MTVGARTNKIQQKHVVLSSWFHWWLSQRCWTLASWKMCRQQQENKRSNLVCPHVTGPWMIVAEPAASRREVQLKHLLLRGVHRGVMDDEFGLSDPGCRENAATCWDVLALTALSPGRARHETMACTQNTQHTTHKHTLYLLRVMLRDVVVVVSGRGRMTEALTLMSISKARPSSSSPSREDTVSDMKPGGAETSE